MFLSFQTSLQLLKNYMQVYPSKPFVPQDLIDEPYCTIFLFINSGSGGGLGSKLVSQQIKKIQFDIPINDASDIRSISVYFINMKKDRDYGFKKLKQLTEKNRRTISVICGGDGTVIWVVSQLAKYQIDPMKTPLAVIPLGTGNDFSRSLNWGPVKTMLLQQNFRSLKKLIRKWLNAQQHQFDIWDITAEVYPNGKFEKVENGDNSLINQKVFKRSFANYFSFGIDGKIGYSFDMHRTSSRIGNLAMYGALGIVKQATKTKTIDQLIESFYIRQSRINQDAVMHKQTLVFRSSFKADSEEKKMDEKTQYITPDLKNILFLNIDSYTGGVQGIWSSAKQIFNEVPKQRDPPSFQDGKIQIVSFTSGTAIALQRSFGGFGNRIAQHCGPFIFDFRQYPNQQKHRTYLQIDGEFIRFTHPMKVIVEKSNLIKNGKIKVLQNDPNFQPYMPS